MSNTPSPWTETHLATLNQERHFRLRGEATTRMETFVDAAFAFAVTMLVISVDDVPRSYEEFKEALMTIPAFVASFFQMMMFWLGHRNWSQRFALEDRFSVALALILVCGILVIVFPLRVVFGAAFGYFSDGLFPFPFDLSWQIMREVFLFYGAGFSVMCTLIAALYWHALNKREWLGLNEVEILRTRYFGIFWLIPAGTGLVAMLTAWLTSGPTILLSGLVYLLLFVLLPIHRLVERKKLRALLAAPV